MYSVGYNYREKYKKVLFIGIRNRYCSVRQQSFTKNQNPPTHRCFLNWKKTSTAMEADAVVEGFSSSLYMHG